MPQLPFENLIDIKKSIELTETAVKEEIANIANLQIFRAEKLEEIQELNIQIIQAEINLEIACVQLKLELSLDPFYEKLATLQSQKMALETKVAKIDRILNPGIAQAEIAAEESIQAKIEKDAKWRKTLRTLAKTALIVGISTSALFKPTENLLNNENKFLLDPTLISSEEITTLIGQTTLDNRQKTIQIANKLYLANLEKGTFIARGIILDKLTDTLAEQEQGEISPK